MTKFKNLASVCEFMESQFGWHCDIEDDNIKVTRHDGESELIYKRELETVALEMWKSLKNNGLNKEVIKEVEEEYF